MQQNPVLRTIRFTVLSIGFVLFVLLAVRSAAHISDPRYLRGNPFLFSLTHSSQMVTGADTANAQDIASVQPIATSTHASTISSGLGQDKAKANGKSEAHTAAAQSQVIPAQLKKPATQTTAHYKD